MAKDALDEVSAREISGNSSMPIPDQQKVPPLRISLNQKGSSSQTKTESTHSDRNKDKAHNNRLDDGPRAEGVRIKFGSTVKQSAKSASQPKPGAQEEQQKTKSTSTDKTDQKEDISSFGHLRRITRRSQRSVQTTLTEDEESVSSMTSVDENQTTPQTNNCDSENTTEAQTNITNPPATSSTTNATTSDRKYKRRKYDSAESIPTDYESFLSQVSYRPLAQNSIDLFRNIRKQVESKLQNLRYIQPKTPHGFRDYMLTKGAYLLDGNKLGNGLNLCMNEQGGLNVAPIAKYYAYKHGRVKYSVPDRAKVPLGLQINSPLYNLFIEQEKERYRMRIQHIKEREKLTLVTEQEIMRVYNRETMVASNQLEPFSACTIIMHQDSMLCHQYPEVMTQEIEDASKSEDLKQEGVRTRRGTTHNRCSTQSTRQPAKPVESQDSKKDKQPQTESSNESQSESTNPSKDEDNDNLTKSSDDVKVEPDVEMKVEETNDESQSCDQHSSPKEDNVKSESSPETNKDQEDTNKEQPTSDGLNDEGTKKDDLIDGKSNVNEKQSNEPPASKGDDERPPGDVPSNQEPDDVEMKKNITSETTTTEDRPALSEADRKIFDKEQFLARLQEIDDKWDKIRREMMIRHKNEADSLHAIQRLEWEWKSKEIGACDVRMTPLIDDNLVPKLTIILQDY